MRALVALLLLASPVAAQPIGNTGYVFSADIGAGVTYGPSYFGSDDDDASPWLILRNGSLLRRGEDGRATTDGFSVLPSLNVIGKRDAGDHDALTGLDDIDAAGELGVRLKYDYAQTSSYVTLRKGFGGHDGVVGELGAKYRFDASDRLTLWTGAEARFGNDDFTRTYFGITADESLTSGYAAYQPDGGFYAASVGVEARYAVTPQIAVLGEVEYTRLLGDAADSALVDDRNQPSVKLGIVRHFSFGF